MYYRTLSAPQVVRFCLLYPLIFVVMGLLLSLLAQSFVALLVFIPAYLLVVLIFFCFYRNAFYMVKMDAEGLHTKKCTVRWEDMDGFCLYSLEKWQYRHMRFFPLSSIIGSGDAKYGSFAEQDPSKVILLTLNHKTVKMIAQYCKEPNETLQKLIDEYSEAAD